MHDPPPHFTEDDCDACDRKRKYRTEIRARMEGMFSLRKDRRAAVLFVYRCVVCDWYHLTSQGNWLLGARSNLPGAISADTPNTAWT